MSKETLFFSYSRDDSAFVLDLAKNLRQAGANVWLDQLDITPGVRWDKAIEKALIQSNILLVILSKSSVESDNVLDEVSFALEEGKTVVPVLLENCEIPFRLRRLQYADFTQNRKIGIQTLIKTLHLNNEVATKLNEYSSQNTDQSYEVFETVKKSQENIESSKPESLDTENLAAEAQNKNSNIKSKKPQTIKKTRNKKIIYGFFAILVLATSFWFSGFLIEDEDTKEFNESLQRNTIQDFEFYISKFPEGKFIDQARDSVYAKSSREKKLKEQQLKQIEEEAWKLAVNNDNFESYQLYITKYPDGEYITTAKQKVAAFSENIENVKQDDQAWNRAVSQATVNAYLEYYTNLNILGSHREEAIKKITEKGIKGWLYSGRISGEKMTESIFELLWRAENFSADDILKPNDIVTLKANESSRRTYKFPANRTSNNTNEVFLSKGIKAYITAVEKEGNALIAQIIY